MRRFLLRFAKILGGLLLLLIVALSVAAVVGIPIDLDRFRDEIERQSSAALGREIRVEGEIRLVVGLFPRFSLGGVTVTNPAQGGWETPHFAELEEVRVALDLPALLDSRVRVPEIAAVGGRANLERAPDGSANWAFDVAEAAEAEPGPEADPEDDAASFEILGVDVEALTLRGMEVQWLDRRAGTRERYALDSLDGRITMDDPLELELVGSLLEHPYQLSITGGPLGALQDLSDRWPMELKLEIARSVLTVSGELEGAALSAVLGRPPMSGEPTPDHNRARLGVELRGQRLHDLDSLVGLQLPPLGPYRVHAELEARDGDRFDGTLGLSVGDSDLGGRLALSQKGPRPKLDITLSSQQVQLDDFDVGDWSPVTGDEPTPDAAPTGSKPKTATDDPANVALLSPEAMRRLDATLKVEVGEVRSGPDVLGSGRLDVTLQDGKLRVKPLSVELPGGSIEIGMGFEPTKTAFLADARIQVKRFDLGVLVRRAAPDATLGGELYLDAALDARAQDPAQLMHHANGYLIVGLWPENLQAGIVDLWAVNLLASVLPAVDSGQGSVVQCAVAALALEDGIMRQRGLMLDTSRMRVTGAIEVDFREEQIAVQLSPQAKKPQFFSLATPVSVSGSFDDFSVGVSAADLIGTVVRMASSAVVVPLKRVMRGSLPEDGSEACTQMLDAARAEAEAGSG